MKNLIILRFLTLSIMMFTTGLITGWWLHHRLEPTTKHQESAESIHGWLPQRDSFFFGDSGTSRLDTSAFAQRLEDLQFDDALVIYQEQERRDPEYLPPLRAELFSHIRQWQDNNLHTRAIAAMERFTQHYFDDQALLDELASNYVHQQNFIKAIETLIAARSYLVDQEARNKITANLHKLSNALFAEHAKAQTLDELIALFQKLMTEEQDFAFYRYALTECYLSIGDHLAAIRELEILQTDAEYGHKASQILASLMPPPEEEPEDLPTGAVPLAAHGQHYIASAELQDRSAIRLMIDTGASVTTMPDSLLKELKRKKMAHRVGHTQLKTASGFVFAPIYQVKELHLGHFILKDIKVAGLETGMQNSDGLLGMNALGQFHFQIDQDRRLLLLQPR